MQLHCMHLLVRTSLLLLKLCLHLPYEVTFEWVSGARAVQEVSTGSEGTRQHPRCAADVIPGWHRYYWQSRRAHEYQFVSVDLDDTLYGFARQNYTSNQFDIAACLQALTILPFQNFRTFVASGEQILVQMSNWLNQGNIIGSWLYFIRIGLKKMWPNKCMLCQAQARELVELEWKQYLEEKFAKLIERVDKMFTHYILTAAKAKPKPPPPLPPARRRAWADALDSSSDDNKEARPAQARAGASLRTAEEVAKNPSGFARGSVATALPKKSILVKATTKRRPDPKAKMADETEVLSIPDVEDYWQLDLCVTSRVLISFSLVEMSPSEAKERSWLMRKPAKGLPWVIMKSQDVEVQQMKTVAEELLQEQPKVQEEIKLMWNHLENITKVHVELRDDMHPLYQMQFFLFVHMLSILLHGCASLPFGVSASFLDAVGKHFWFRTQLDILELVARYVYALWSSPPVDAEAWNQGFYGFFIPNNQMKACVWWKGMQEAILSQNQDVFCEEYCCVTRSVAADGRGFSFFNSKRSAIAIADRPCMSFLNSHIFITG